MKMKPSEANAAAACAKAWDIGLNTKISCGRMRERTREKMKIKLSEVNTAAACAEAWEIALNTKVTKAKIPCGRTRGQRSLGRRIWSTRRQAAGLRQVAAI